MLLTAGSQTIRTLLKLDFSDGVWRRDSLIVVPDAEDLRRKCLSSHHDTDAS